MIIYYDYVETYHENQHHTVFYKVETVQMSINEFENEEGFSSPVLHAYHGIF